MLGDMALHEQRAALRVDADGEEELREFEGPCPEHGRILGDGERVEIDDTEDGVGLTLIGHPVAESSEEGAELDRPGGFDAREDACHGGDARGSAGWVRESHEGAHRPSTLA